MECSCRLLLSVALGLRHLSNQCHWLHRIIVLLLSLVLGTNLLKQWRSKAKGSLLSFPSSTFTPATLCSAGLRIIQSWCFLTKMNTDTNLHLKFCNMRKPLGRIHGPLGTAVLAFHLEAAGHWPNILLTWRHHPSLLDNLEGRGYTMVPDNKVHDQSCWNWYNIPQSCSQIEMKHHKTYQLGKQCPYRLLLRRQYLY